MKTIMILLMAVSLWAQSMNCNTCQTYTGVFIVDDDGSITCRECVLDFKFEKLEDRIKALEEKVKELEKRPVFIADKIEGVDVEVDFYDEKEEKCKNL